MRPASAPVLSHADVGCFPWVEPTNVIPVHYEGWSHFKQDRNDAEPELAASTVAPAMHWLDPGEATNVRV